MKMKMNEVVYNACYGGFGLSEEAKALYIKISKTNPDSFYDGDISRHDPVLVKVVKKLKEKVNTRFSELKIAKIEGNLYRIDEYDGYESVETPGDVSWVTIPEQTK